MELWSPRERLTLHFSHEAACTRRHLRSKDVRVNDTSRCGLRQRAQLLYANMPKITVER